MAFASGRLPGTTTKVHREVFDLALDSVGDSMGLYFDHAGLSRSAAAQCTWSVQSSASDNAALTSLSHSGWVTSGPTNRPPMVAATAVLGMAYNRKAVPTAGAK